MMRGNAIGNRADANGFEGRYLSVRRECLASFFVLADLATAAMARTYINCATREVVIEEGKSSVHETSASFWLDDVSKTITLADGTPLTVTRFDDIWIRATHGGISYEFDRIRHRVSYASSTERDRVTTVIFGSGRCESEPRRP